MSRLQCDQKTLSSWKKDTVTTNKEDDKVNADHHVGKDWPSIGHNAIIHHSVPVLSGKDLQRKAVREERNKRHKYRIRQL